MLQLEKECCILEYIKLIGVVIIVLGFMMKFDVLATVLISGLVTGLVSGLSFTEILAIMGQSFVNNRLMSVWLIIFPVIAIIERYGLKERASYLIGKIRNASAGKVLCLYMIIRSAASGANIRIGGQVEFVRPLILPMSEAAAEKAKGSQLSEKEEDSLKGLAAATENYGNFFAQNVFPVASGVLLIQGTLAEAGYGSATIYSVAQASYPICIIAIILTFVQVLRYDRKIKKARMNTNGNDI